MMQTQQQLPVLLWNWHLASTEIKPFAPNICNQSSILDSSGYRLGGFCLKTFTKCVNGNPKPLVST
ncbi:MAG: hypothetical protein F6K41_23935 [Symploca sp. SIO3E6]|nr:hypothetical protein [Caldora sp. SIO3E6]